MPTRTDPRETICTDAVNFLHSAHRGFIPGVCSSHRRRRSHQAEGVEGVRSVCVGVCVCVRRVGEEGGSGVWVGP
jgi:hypothetical protein